MARIQCGNCGGVHARAADVRDCYATTPSLFAAEAGRSNATPSGADPVDDELSDADRFGPDPFDAEGYEGYEPDPFEPAPVDTGPAVTGPADIGPADTGPADTAPPRAGRSAIAPAGVPARDAGQLAGPDALGRNLVVAAGGSAPPPWDGALWITIDERVLADPAALLEALRPRWHARERMVFELAVDLRPDGAVAVGAPLWELDVTTLPDLDVLHHLIWANAVDGRTPPRARWTWAERAVELGAAFAPEGTTGDVVLADGRPAWCDGGPLRHPDDLGAEQLGAVVLHRFGLEAGSLRPLGSNAAGGTAAVLAADQRAAVTHPAGAARIIAPAGSGKTRVLTERARLLLDGWQLPTGGLCLVAFNRRAAEEMVGRTADLPRLHVRTLNALGLAILDGRPPFRRRAAGRHEVLDERAVRRLLDGLVAIPRNRRRVNTDPMAPWLDALSAVRLGLRDPAEVEDDLEGEVDGLGDVLERYRAGLAERHQLDFDEQIVGAIEVLLAEPETRRAAQAACRLLLVDEFQDLTPAHLLLIRLLSAPDLAVFGVGDDDQTIYGYTGATPDWLIRYTELFPGSGAHALEVNYRCPAAVVGAADRLLRHNRRRVAKAIRARPADDASAGAGGPEGLSVVEAGSAAVAATSDAVAAALAGGASPGEVAVLARVNASLAPVQVALAHRGIPVRPVVDAGWLERTGIRAALGWLRLATQPGRFRAADVSDTTRRPGRGLSARVVEWMAEQRDLDGLTRLSTRLRDRDGEKVAAYVADLEALAGLAGAGSSTAELLTAVRDRIGLDEAMDLLDSSQRSVKGSAQGDDLDALVALAALHADAATFGVWLREQLARPGDPNGVLLSTVHVAKGREWPHVVVHEATDGLFPHRLADDGEEERRVFHVAITRAIRSATVVCGADPSPFVAELFADAPAPPPEPSPERKAAGRGAERERRGTGSAAGTRGRRGRDQPGRDQVGPAGGSELDGPTAEVLLRALRTWRTERARRDGMPAYIVFPDATLEQIIARAPRTMVRLAQIKGIGPTKLDRYGDEVLAVLDEVLGQT